MTRCECHGVEFKAIVDFAHETGYYHLDDLKERIGFGQTCTACHYDLQGILKEELQKTKLHEPEPADARDAA